MRDTADTLKRQWSLLTHMPIHPHWHSTRQLHERVANEGFEVSRRTTQRDLDWLSSSFPIVSEERGRALYWQWMRGAQGLEIPAMSRTTALVFQQANRYLQTLMPAGVLELLEPYFRRADEALKDTKFADWERKVMHVETGPPLTPPEVDPGVRDVVYEALLENRRFAATYTPRYESEPAGYEVNPLGMVTREGIAYLVCTLWEYEDVRQLALHRIQSANLLQYEARGKVGFSLERYVREEAGFGYPEAARRIRLKALFDEGAAFHLSERRLAEDQSLKRTADGTYRLTATVQDTAELRWWLLGFGDGVEVLAPKALRGEFRKVAESMGWMYA